MAKIESQKMPNAAPYPKPSYAWYMVVILTIAYVLSFIDRYILGLLVEPIKADLELSDTQMGLLLGPAFAIFYALMGLPLGWMADHKNRVRLVAFGVGLWSIATVMSGIARNFTHLFLMRIGVGVGEAVLSPCTMSLVADSFPKEKRARPIALYTTSISVGAGIAALTGAAVIGWANNSSTIAVPVLGELKPWQLTLVIVGLPGLLVAPFLYFLKEPARQSDNVSSKEVNKASISDTARYLGKRWPLFTGFVAVFCFMTIVGYSTSWGASLFSRTWGWSAPQYGKMAGIMFLIVGPITVNFAGWLSDHLSAKGVVDAPLLIPIIGVPIMIAGGVAWPLMPTPELAIVVLGITMAGVALASATGATALLAIVPAQLRGQSVAIYYMFISFFGLGFGPTTIGLLNDHVFSEATLRYSMAVLPLIYGIPLLFLLPWIRRKYRNEFNNIYGGASRKTELTKESNLETSE